MVCVNSLFKMYYTYLYFVYLYTVSITIFIPIRQITNLGSNLIFVVLP